MGFLIVIVFFVIIPLFCYFIEWLNLGDNECSRCHKVKRGVTKRDVYIKRLGGASYKSSVRQYLCDDCAKGHNFTVVHEVDDTDYSVSDDDYY